MDQELRAYLDEMKSELSRIIDGLEGKLVGLETRLLGEIQSSEERGREHTELVETRLLTEFWKWARTTEARYRQETSVVGTLNERVKMVEDRVSELERRKPS